MLVERANLLLRTATDEPEPGERVRQTVMLRSCLSQLRAICSDFPAIKLEALAAFEADLARAEDGTTQMMRERPLNHRQREVVSNHTSQFVEGMRFSATLQLRTPLWRLRRDGEVRDPHDIDHNFLQWMGIWSIKTKSINEFFGAGIDEMIEDRSCGATPLGPLPRSDFLPFLIAVREAVEGTRIEERKVARVEALRDNPLWSGYIDRLGGAKAIVQRT